MSLRSIVGIAGLSALTAVYAQSKISTQCTDFVYTEPWFFAQCRNDVDGSPVGSGVYLEHKIMNHDGQLKFGDG